ncbi:MAG: DUF1211 domain-containing protein [candidate division SR1 bacterium]|nr:DUF1211 domain-containing protein [candidate division SR1 bacterium]
MSKFRLEALSDALFAIVLTLLVIEIKIPELYEKFTEDALLHSLQEKLPLFFAYFLSFTMLATFWYTHNFLFSLMSKSVTRGLMNLNFIFMAFLSLIPFSSHLLGQYTQSRVAVAVYSLNIAIMAGLNWWIREYVYSNPKIENPKFQEVMVTRKDLVYGTVRVWVGFAGSILAVAVALISTYISLFVLILQAFVLIVPGMIGLVTKLFKLENMKLRGSLAQLDIVD